LDFLRKSAVFLTDNFGSFKTCLVIFNPSGYLLDIFTVGNKVRAFFGAGTPSSLKKRQV